MTKTKYYDLQMDDPQDDYDVEVVNANLKKIDEQMKTRENATDALQEPEFTEAKERKNLTSGEKIYLMLGKISKFFSDMKAIAFSGSYNDLVDKPKIPTVLNNQTTTEEGYALDARQANPNIDGTLAKQVADLNGSLNNDINALNPSDSIKAYIKCYPGGNGEGWYRFSEIIFNNTNVANGALCYYIEILIMQMYNFAPGCFHKISIYMKVQDSAKITSIGQNATVVKKVRAVRKDNVIFLDMYTGAITNDSYVLLNIPFGARINSAKCIEPYLVPETADGEVVVCSVDLADNV